MHILVCGASGFIGRALCARLSSAGHTVVRGVRRPRHAGELAIDFARDTDPAVWAGRLAGIEAVVNAVGIIVERRGASFEAIHHRAPAALFAACATAGVRRVVQISALGAAQGDTPYFRTKYAADQALMQLPLAWQILRPSLVYGAQGASATMFRMLATLPVVPVPQLDGARFQPVHVDDLCEAVERALLNEPERQEIDLVGATALTYPDMLACYRRGMGGGRPRFLTIPAVLLTAGAWCFGWIPGAVLTPATWRMLRAGSAGDAAGITRLLGRPPRAAADFIAPDEAGLLRLRAQAGWRDLLLRVALALVWIVTAVVSAGLYPVADSMALLARLGLTGASAQAALCGAVLLDLVLGVATLVAPGRRLWLFQAGLVLGYSAVIAVAMPEFLIHPFGPLTKNLPILAILLILHAEAEPWNT